MKTNIYWILQERIRGFGVGGDRTPWRVNGLKVAVYDWVLTNICLNQQKKICYILLVYDSQIKLLLWLQSRNEVNLTCVAVTSGE